MPKKIPILITGGGSGGHITPLLTVAKALEKKLKNLQIIYVGSGNALERKLVQDTDFEYKSISTGKLRRYFSWENFRDFFRFLKGIFQAYQIIKKTKPQLVFSKGGFVSLPVCISAYLCKVPIILHESDTVMGLANRIIGKTAQRICMTFDLKPQKNKYKYILTGTPVRKELLKGKKQETLQKLNFTKNKPVLLIMGGSQGAQFVNELIYKNLEKLLQTFQIIHICGHGKQKLIKQIGYISYEYVQEELADLYAISSLILSRAGANSLAEISLLQKPNILIPLPTSANNHQYFNAQYFANQNASILLEQKKITSNLFLETILELNQNKTKQKAMKKNLKKIFKPDAVKEIVEIIEKELGKKY